MLLAWLFASLNYNLKEHNEKNYNSFIFFLTIILNFSLAKENQLKASFTLNASNVMAGVKVPDSFEATQVYANLTDEFFNGQTNAIEIYFYKGEIKEPRENYDAVMTLFIDKNNKIWQVNMTYVIPGFTAARTIAGTSKELEQFSEYTFDQDALNLKSKGRYDDKVDNQLVNLTWDIDINIPIINRIKK